MNSKVESLTTFLCAKLILPKDFGEDLLYKDVMDFTSVRRNVGRNLLKVCDKCLLLTSTLQPLVL